jgi:L-ribulose-5-phosphate 3-epimerase
MIQNIGFMQGRLSDPIDNKIQAFPWPFWQKEFSAARELGFSLMEWTLDQENLYKNPLMTEQGQVEILSLCNKFHISIPSITCDCFMQNPFWKSKNKNTILSLQKDFYSILIGCNMIGIQNIVIPLVDNGSLDNQEQEHSLVNFLNSNIYFFKKLNLKILFESDFTPDKLHHFIDQFNAEFFGINYDTGNSASFGFDPSEEFKAFGTRILNVHIKDRPIDGTTVALGDGDVDFNLIIKLLNQYSYKHNIILQTARASNNNHKETLLLYKKFIENKIINYEAEPKR